MTAAMRLGVLGSPIAHSRSPRIHAAAYAALGLDWRYDAIRCGAAGLGAFLRGRDAHWRGFSLTMPLKEEAHRLADALDPVATESGVVNTLHRLPDGGWFGSNTDVAGLARALGQAGLDATRTVVLGAGATAVSAILAARALGAERVAVLARRPRAVEELLDRFRGTSAPEMTGATLGDASAARAAASSATLVVSTLPGPAGREIPLPDGLAAAPLFDVAYDPWPSPLAGRWRAAGGISHAGLEMLVEQALIQVRLFLHGDAEAPLADEAGVLAAMRRAAR
ncbi:shikimate dehydrogenase [Leucobacter allii]|uniref:Shikimate dehydrogenase n=1 Tax=Leucobacter allii TaxID=2932247 RepID=A0ABY4FQW7_9MICO|nr:shikimate dehydrogenase [Leucobacter allii]UOQ58685.1 shikimate dehydrogenase [Leucobacter allii]